MPQIKPIAFQQPQIDPRLLQQFAPASGLGNVPWIPEYQDPSDAEDRLPISETLLKQGMDTSPLHGGGWIEGLTRMLAGTLGGYWRGQDLRKKHGIEAENRALTSSVLESNDTEDPRVAGALISSPDPLAQALGKSLMERIPTRGEEELLDIRRQGLDIQKKGLEDETAWRQRNLDLQQQRDLDAVSEDVTRTQQASNVLAETRAQNMREFNQKEYELSPEYLRNKAEAELLARGGTGTRVQSHVDLGDGRVLITMDNGGIGIVTDQGLQMIREAPIGSQGPIGIGDVPNTNQPSAQPPVPGQQTANQPPSPLLSTHAPNAVQDRALAQWRGKNRATRELNLPKAQAALSEYENKVGFLEQKIDEITGTFDPTKKDDPKTPEKEGRSGDQGMIGFWSTGLPGWIGNQLPMDTPGGELASALDTIKASVAFDTLQRMRDASPTGGALGNVTDQEIRFLQSAMGSLEQIRNDPERLRRTLREIKTRLEGFRKMRQDAFQQDYGDLLAPTPRPTPPPPPGTGFGGVPQGGAGGRTLEQLMQQFGGP